MSKWIVYCCCIPSVLYLITGVLLARRSVILGDDDVDGPASWLFIWPLLAWIRFDDWANHDAGELFDRTVERMNAWLNKLFGRKEEDGEED